MFGAEPSAFDQSTVGVMANAPDVLKPMMAFQAALKAHSKLPPRLRELVRLRVAFHNQCRSCMATRSPAALDDGLTEDLVCSLEKPQEACDLTPQEKAALAYADLASTNHFAITDETFDMLREHFTDEQIVELGVSIGMAIGFGRFGAALHMVDALPEAYQQEDSIAPWTHAPISGA
jgi:AhpD family alkylhydroperoxidase